MIIPFHVLLDHPLAFVRPKKANLDSYGTLIYGKTKALVGIVSWR